MRKYTARVHAMHNAQVPFRVPQSSPATRRKLELINSKATGTPSIYRAASTSVLALHSRSPTSLAKRREGPRPSTQPLPGKRQPLAHGSPSDAARPPTAPECSSAATHSWRQKKTQARGVKYYEHTVTKQRLWQCPDELLPPLTPAGCNTSTMGTRELHGFRPLEESAVPDYMKDHVQLSLASDPTFYLPPDAYKMCRRHELGALSSELAKAP